MTAFDPEKFEDKYIYYMDELQTAYKNAYQHFHGRYDSTLLKAIDRQVLDGSEPFYEGSAERSSADNSSGQGPREYDGDFRVELLENPRDRVGSLPVDDETFNAVLQKFVDRIELELQRIFEFDDA